VDLAMARLFGGFPEAFFAGYHQEWPLPPGAEGRVSLYNLYHLLNHANLFDGGPGGSYGRQVQAVIHRLLRELE
jgi:fructosamine-3-kinase